MSNSFPRTTVPQAVQAMAAGFPFPGYFDGIGVGSHTHVAELLVGLLPSGGAVLDIGAGPLDKTAVLAKLGFACTAVDDYADPWHVQNGALEKIKAYGQAEGIRVVKTGPHDPLPVPAASQDAVLLCDVLEHLPVSPKALLEAALHTLKPGGYLLITVPNAVNLRKRLDVLRGRTNLPPYSQYYHCGGVWRGHIREYVKNDLEQLEAFLGTTRVHLASAHHMLGVLPRWAQTPFQLATLLAPGWRDSWVYVGQKPQGWQPKT